MIKFEFGSMSYSWLCWAIEFVAPTVPSIGPRNRDMFACRGGAWAFWAKISAWLSVWAY